MKLCHIIFLFLFFYAFNTQAQNEEYRKYFDDPEGQIRDHNLDFIKLSLDVSFIPEDGKVIGRATYLFKPLQYQVDSVFLDGPGILAGNVQLNNVNTNFKMDSAGITVYFNPVLDWSTNYELTIDYTAYPKKGIYFVGWDHPLTIDPNDPDRIRKQIWTQGEGTDNRFWIPSYDGVNDKLITELNITFDKNYTVVSNGDLSAKETVNGDLQTWHYKMSHPQVLYLVMLAIGEYDKQEYFSKNGITTTQYYYPDKLKNVAPTYQYSSEMMDWMENELKVKYPWNTYANIPVQEFIYGAMENTTATIYSDYFFQDAAAYPDKNYMAINAHELTHQWFGDYVSAWSGASQWLQESFATYYSKKFRQAVLGEDTYQWIRHDEMQTAFDADAKNNLPVGHSDAGGARIYQKGSIVLDMLRYVTGEEQFKKVITEFLLAHPYANVESHDLEMQFMKTLGMNLNWFFDEWIYRGGYPEYTISYSKTSEFTDILVNQTQKISETVGLFKMPVHIQVHYTDGDFTDQLFTIEKQSTTCRIQNPDHKEIAFVLFDPGKMILAHEIFKREYTELRFQAFNAPVMIDRYRAIFEMREVPAETKRADLIKIYDKENFYALRSEIIFQLANDSDKTTVAMLKKALQDPDANVRRAVITNISYIPKKAEKDLALLLQDVNYTNIEITLNKLCAINPDKKTKYLEATKTATGANKNIRIAWLEIACATEPEKYINELIVYTSDNYEFRTRVDAINSLQNLNYCNEAVVINLLNAASSSNGRLAGPARTAIKRIMENDAYKTMFKNYYASHLWNEYETYKLEPLFEH